jgi:hypothetical protein
MSLIVSLETQQSLKPISQNWATYIKIVGGVTNYEQLAKEVEQVELKKLLGLDFYFDFYLNQTKAEYVTLIEGATFQNYLGNTVAFNGLKYILAFMNYSKYVGEGFASDTATGMVKKNREQSESLSNTEIKRIQSDAREIAIQDFEIMKIYLNINYDKYPLWNYRKREKVYRPRISGLKRTIL